MAKVKFGQRLFRAVMYGVVGGYLMFFITYFLVSAINGIAGTTVIDPVYLGMGSFALGFTTPVAIEISKDIENSR